MTEAPAEPPVRLGPAAANIARSIWHQKELLVLGLVLGAIMALRPRTPGTRIGSWLGTTLVLLSWLILLPMGLFGVAILLHWVPPPAGVAMPSWSSVLTPLAYSAFPAWFLLGDLRFRRLQGDAHRFRVAHLADDDHVRRLPDGGAQRTLVPRALAQAAHEHGDVASVGHGSS